MSYVACAQSSNLMSVFIKIGGNDYKWGVSGQKSNKFNYIIQQVNRKFIMILVGALRIDPLEFLIATLWKHIWKLDFKEANSGIGKYCIRKNIDQ